MLVDYMIDVLLVPSLLPQGRIVVLSLHHVILRVLRPHGVVRVLIGDGDDGDLVAWKLSSDLTASLHML